MTKLFKCDGCGQTASGEPVSIYAYSTTEDSRRIVRTADMHLVCFASLKLVQGKADSNGLVTEHHYQVEWIEKAVKPRVRTS